MYKLGLVSISFRDKSPEEILIAMKKAELHFIEWGSDVHAPKGDTKKIEKIVNLQNKYGIKCSSYGTYFRLGETPLSELEDYISTAKLLGTNILRLWCGNKNSEDLTKDEKEKLFSECKKAALIAEKQNAVLCMECHSGTYTNTKESALELMNEVNSSAFRMYWQPNQLKKKEENCAYAELLSKYTEHIHIFNWIGNETFPLEDGIEIWKEYLGKFGNDKTLLLEFMPDNCIDSLKREADSLRKITEGNI